MGCGGKRRERRRLESFGRSMGLLSLLPLLLLATRAQAGCLTLASGPIVYDVSGCKLIEPESTFDLGKDRFRFIADLDAESRKDFFNSYRGLYVRGKVVKSDAVAKGISTQTAVLSGETVFLFLPPPLTLQCDAVLGKRLAGNLRQMCCDGGGDVPCLLNTEYLLTSPEVVGGVASASGDAKRQRAQRSKAVKDGDRSFAAKKYKDAAKHYEIARGNGELDVRGSYRLGYSYRELDQCRDAIAPLRSIYDMHLKKQVWADEEKTARAAIFLLARCYAKINDPGPAVLILNGYLVEHEKYATELKDSLRHRDFGWIHTSKEYRDYKKAAQKKITP